MAIPPGMRQTMMLKLTWTQLPTMREAQSLDVWEYAAPEECVCLAVCVLSIFMPAGPHSEH